jgi:hypothetical protein
MAELPILFSAPMIIALLEGRKTQTRRLLKPQPEGWSPEPKLTEIHRLKDGRPVCPTEVGAVLGMGFASEDGLNGFVSKYQIGDRLWVRETWQPHSLYADRAPRNVPPSIVFYRADGGYSPSMPWKPGIHMPRHASRLTLVVTDVRVQLLQDISEEDARAEGAAYEDSSEYGGAGGYDGPSKTHWTAKSWFCDLWDSLKGPGAWDANPWVSAISFDVHQCNIDRGGGSVMTLRILSLGAGVQSTTMALMAAHGEIPMPDYAVFADTKAEPAAVYEHLRWISGGNVLPFPVVTVTGGSLREGLRTPGRFVSVPFFGRKPNGKPMMALPAAEAFSNTRRSRTARAI